ncbi:MAG: HAMP domain-containing sensor histidine kinase [Microthrixaceae bacterium]
MNPRPDSPGPTESERSEPRLLAHWVVPGLILTAGMVVAVAVASFGNAPASDTVVLVATALGGAAVAVAVVLLITASRPRTTVGTQAAAVALASVSATIVGVLAGARAMFISSHDLTALGVIVATATGAGLTVAWRLGTKVDNDVHRLTRLSERLAAGESAEVPAMRIRELDRLGGDLVSMADRLAEAHDRELALERSRSELVAWISHDLRSPLAAIRAMAEAIEDGVVSDPAEVHRYLHSIGEETERLAALVDDLFELSKVASGLVEFRSSRVSVGEILRCRPTASPWSPKPTGRAAVAADGAHRFPGGAVRIAGRDRAGAAEPARQRDPSHPEGGVVSIEVSEVANAVEVSVIDQCGGIPAPDLERVFDVAFRGDNARRPRWRGRRTRPRRRAGADRGAGRINCGVQPCGRLLFLGAAPHCRSSLGRGRPIGRTSVSRRLVRHEQSAHVTDRSDRAPDGAGDLGGPDPGPVVDDDLGDPPSLTRGRQHHLQWPAGSTVTETEGPELVGPRTRIGPRSDSSTPVRRRSSAAMKRFARRAWAGQAPRSALGLRGRDPPNRRSRDRPPWGVGGDRSWHRRP